MGVKMSQETIEPILSSEDPKIANRVRTVLSRTFEIPPAECRTGFRMGGHPKWDSMGHMDLVANLEKEFKVRIPQHLISKVVEFDAIVNTMGSLKR